MYTRVMIYHLLVYFSIDQRASLKHADTVSVHKINTCYDYCFIYDVFLQYCTKTELTVAIMQLVYHAFVFGFNYQGVEIFC